MKHLKLRILGVRTEQLLKYICILSGVIFLGVALVLPLYTLFAKAFEDANGTFVGWKHFVTYFTNERLLTSVTNTLAIAIISTIISVTLAFFFAYSLTRKVVPFKGMLRYIGMLPIYAPTMLLGIGLIYIFGNKGLLTGLGLVVPLYGKVGIIIAESIYCFPVTLTILMVAFSSADHRLYEAADTMGTSSLRKMFTITLPNVKYGLISAIFVAFTYSFTDFGAPSVVGGNYNVLATDVYKQVIGQQNFNMGAVVGIVLLLPAILSFVVDGIVNRRQHASVGAKAVPYQIKPHKISDRVASVYCYSIALILLGFFGVSVFASLIKMWPYNLDFTLSHYDFSKVAAGDGLKAIQNSLFIALLTACIGTGIAFFLAYFVEKQKTCYWLRKVNYFLAITPLAIPGTVIGLSYILFFNSKVLSIPFTQYVIVNPFHGMYGTIWILILVNIIHYFSVPFTTAMTALKKLAGEFEVVSDSMGVPFYVTLKRVTIPMCMPAITEMFVYFFVNAMVTVSAVVFLYAPTVKIASVVIVNLEGAGDVAAAVAMCMSLLGINVIVRLVYDGILKCISLAKAKRAKAPVSE